MTLELWNTIFAGATFAVVAAAAVAALIQLRHLSAGNQLSTLLTLLEMWQTPEMQEHIKYARTDLQQKIKDPAYLKQYGAYGVSRAEHPELLVADYWENIGTFMKYQLFDENPWLDIAAAQVIFTWELLEPVVLAMQAEVGSAAYENFEYAATRARLWQARHPRGAFPTNAPRMARLKQLMQVSRRPQ